MVRKTKHSHIKNLQVQSLSDKHIFSSQDLVWSDIQCEDGTIDRTALIPYNRLEDFIMGEQNNLDAPCTFVRRSNRKRFCDGDSSMMGPTSLNYALFQCCYGLNDLRGHPQPPLRKRNFVQKRGCQCKFIAKEVNDMPGVAIITYNEYLHEDCNGWPCHEKYDKYGDPKSFSTPRLSKEIQSMIQTLCGLGVPVDTIFERHILDGLFGSVMGARDLKLCRKDVSNIFNRHLKDKYQLDPKDSLSVNKWYQQEKKSFLFYQRPEGEDVPFILGIQTEWMLDMMVKCSHNNMLALDSTFSTNKYARGVPVAWAVCSHNRTSYIAQWLRPLLDACRKRCPNWKLNVVMTDDALAEIKALSWHVRRAWSKNAFQLASSPEISRELSHSLGEIMHRCRDHDAVNEAMRTFFEKFVGEVKFLDYFRKHWLEGDKIFMWAKCYRDFPHANQESNSSIESYHCFLKTKFLRDRRRKGSRRMDWLIFCLLMRVEPFFVHRNYLKESGFLTNWKKERYLETSLEKSRRIPDNDVSPHDIVEGAYMVISQTDAAKYYIVSTSTANGLVCDCPWALRGNTCKHVLKVSALYGICNEITQEDAIEEATMDELLEEQAAYMPHTNDATNDANGDNDATNDANGDNENAHENRSGDNVGGDDGNSLHQGSNDCDLIIQGILEKLQGLQDAIDHAPREQHKCLEMKEYLERFIIDFNDKFIVDFDFTNDPQALDGSLRRKKSWISPCFKRRRRARRALAEDLNVNAEEYMPYEFTKSSQRGRRKVASMTNPQCGIIVASMPNRGNQTHFPFDLNNFPNDNK